MKDTWTLDELYTGTGEVRTCGPCRRSHKKLGPHLCGIDRDSSCGGWLGTSSFEGPTPERSCSSRPAHCLAGEASPLRENVASVRGALDRHTRLLRRFPQDRCLARLGPGVRREALHAAAHRCGCGSLPVCSPSGTVTRRGSKGDCPARSSTAHLAVPIGTRREQENAMTKVIIGVDPHKLSATIEVVDRPREAARARAGSAPTRPATPRCGPTRRTGPTGSGRSRAATAPAARWRSGSSRPASVSWTCRPSSPPGSGSSTPATTARPTPATPTPSRSSRSAPRPAGPARRR